MDTDNEVLKNQGLLRNARREVVDRAGKFVKVTQVKEGDYLCIQGDAQSPLIFLIAGQLRLSTYAEDGSEIPVGVVAPLESAGEASILNRAPICANVAAARDSTVALLDRVHARQLLDDPDVARALNRQMAQRFTMLVTDRGSQSLSRAGARVSAVIKAAVGEQEFVELPNQSTIAAMAKVSRETVSRVISSLEKRGVIKREGKAICIRDRVALHQLASG
jgi:CRP-like cAMP-binding protein